MREILFRGKRIDNGGFIEGHLYGIWDKKYILWGQTNHVPNGEEVIPETVGQFTGLTDKNGVKIFEGDLIKWFVNNRSSIGCVYFESGWFDLRDENGSIGWDPIRGSSEIIGNIHDNPELLS